MHCLYLFGMAQENMLSGQVNDSLGNPIALAHVMVFNSNTFVVGTVTDTDGGFTIASLEQGSYVLKIIAIGYEDFVQEFAHEENLIDFGSISLKTTAIELNGVALIARKKLYEKHGNSLIINVEQNVASAGGSVLELLSNTAGVSVNQQNGALSLNNQGKIAIMINGKPSRVDGQALISLLKSMPASNIKNLEVFNNPPSKYEANGSGGMINIVTKSKSNDGQGGSISLNSGYGKGEKTGISVNIHSNQGKIDWYGSYAFNRNRTPEEWKLQSEFNSPLSQKKVVANSLRKPIINAHNYLVGTEFSLFKNTNVGINLSGYNSKWDMIAFDKVIRNGGTDNTETINIDTKEANEWGHIGVNMLLEQSLGDQHALTFEYAHLYYNFNNPSTYDTQEQMDFFEILKITPITFNVFNLDYKVGLSEKVKVEFGAKTTSSNFTNTIEASSNDGNVSNIDDELSSTTRMDEQIQGIYASFEFQLGEKTRFTSGLRFEHTSSKLDINDTDTILNRTYDNFFPSLTLDHQLNDVHRFQFNYGRRINRPTFDNLAPYILFLGPEALYAGNTNLQPSLVHKIGAEWRWAGKYISLEYLIEKDAIVEFQPRLSTNGEQYIFKAENMDKRNMLSISMGVPFSITPWWQTETSFIYQYETLQFNFQEVEFNRSKGSLRANSSQQFSISAKTKLELSGYYQSSTLFGISTFGARGSLNVGVQQQLKKNHGNVKLSLSNVFASDNWKINTINEQPFINTLETYFPESRILTFTYTKNFGGSTKTPKYIGNSADDEKQRVQ
ncbi:Outer membrane receptor proteins, mostly Fe transport [Kriegella aquimaris]|uniref:Outer membrane receptor proteins, mostly Fe transport n=2 Tax=Kriegella aquimaris TaxID=192904 RepID=A0A1G9S8Q1_9FLAO|nr:Outer membrane receptor proteins, mostly Fe transport [Kriegella aquimaris]